MMIPIGLNTIKSGGISSRNRNCSESVQRSRDVLFPARHQGGIRTAAALHNLGEDGNRIFTTLPVVPVPERTDRE